MEKLINTYGFDLKQVAEDAKANGNETFAEVIENQLANIQTIYDTIADKHSCTGENLWNIDAEYVKGQLK